MSLWRPRLKRAARATWGLDARQLAWRAGGEPAGAVRCAPHVEALPQALAHLDPHRRIDVIAGNDIAVHWLQTPPTSAASLDELRLVAAARCTYLYGGSPGDWWIAADWHATMPFVCAALPYSIIAPLQQNLAAAGVAARWHTAWGVACGSETNTFPSHGWSALRSPTRLLLWRSREAQVDCLSTQNLLPATTDEVAVENARSQIQIEALRDVSMPTEPLHWVSLTTQNGPEPSEAIAALELGLLLEGAAA